MSKIERKSKTIMFLLIIAVMFAFTLSSIDIKSDTKNNRECANIINKPKINLSSERKNVYLDLEIQDTAVGKENQRVIIELFDDIVPKTTRNFYQLCKEGKYVGCPFHRVIANFMVQSGDFINFDGSSGKSIYGETFEDENFLIKHTNEGYVSMANSGSNTNNSQFFITLSPQPHLNGKHVVFGRIVQGMSFIHKIGNQATDMSDRPIQDTIIKNCGIIN
jgi:cyclophilin family peptidyl-prolyl cis-trans isomerase